MRDGSGVRAPTHDELRAIRQWRAEWEEKLRGKPDVELHGILWALALEIGGRDGPGNAAAAFDHWRQKLLAAAANGTKH